MKKKLIIFLILFSFMFIFIPKCYVNAEEVVEVQKYTLKYNANGGKLSLSSITLDSGSLVTITSKKPTRSNYKFIGWATVKNAKTSEYKSGNQIELNSNITLYAIWGKKIKVTLNANGGSVSKKTVTAYEKTNYPSLITPKRKGYTFTGWYTKKSGGTKVENTTTVTKTKNHTLYAHWKKITYTINYNLNGGTNNSKNKTTYNITSTVKLYNPSKTGYTFKGWYTTNKYKTKVTQIRKGTTGNKTYYSKWSVNKYQIVYNGNGNTSGKMSAKTGIKYNSNYTLATNKYSKKGYLFAGWNTKKDGSGKTYFDKDVVSKLTSKNNGKVTLYAQWTKPYNITYNLNDGINDIKNPTTYKPGDSFTLLNPTRKGYTFDGWYKDSSYTTSITNILSTTRGNLNLYAKWNIISYTITYNLNGGENNNLNPTTYTIETNIDLKEPTKYGYTFNGWYTNESLTNKITNIKNQTGNLTLYASWTITEYPITYNLNGGENNNLNPDTYTIDTNIDLNAPTKDGYIFNGWYTDENFTNEITTINNQIGNLTLYAKWGNDYLKLDTSSVQGEPGDIINVKVTSYDPSLVLKATSSHPNTGYDMDQSDAVNTSIEEGYSNTYMKEYDLSLEIVRKGTYGVTVYGESSDTQETTELKVVSVECDKDPWDNIELILPSSGIVTSLLNDNETIHIDETTFNYNYYYVEENDKISTVKFNITVLEHSENEFFYQDAYMYDENDQLLGTGILSYDPSLNEGDTSEVTFNIMNGTKKIKFVSPFTEGEWSYNEKKAMYSMTVNASEYLNSAFSYIDSEEAALAEKDKTIKILTYLDSVITMKNGLPLDEELYSKNVEEYNEEMSNSELSDNDEQLYNVINNKLATAEVNKLNYYKYLIEETNTQMPLIISDYQETINNEELSIFEMIAEIVQIRYDFSLLYADYMIPTFYLLDIKEY